MGEKAAASPSELVAGLQSAAGDELARLAALARRTEGFIDSEISGLSMGAALPEGARIRIRPGGEESWRCGQVVAFTAGHRFMAHRIVYEGRRAAARHFVLTHGDGNWLCDPPVNRTTIIGLIDSYSIAGKSYQVGGPEIPPYRRMVYWASLALMVPALETAPRFAIALARVMSWARMAPRMIFSRLRLRLGGHVRN